MPPCAATRRLSILFYSHTGLTSGAERVLLTTLAGLDRTRFKPLAACPSEGDLGTLIAEQAVPLFPVAQLQARFTTSPRLLLRYFRSFVAVIASLRGLVKTVAPDVLHANSVRAGLVATMATIGLGTPVAWHVHDDLPDHPLSTLIRHVAFLSRRTTLLAVSHATAAAFRGTLPFGDRLHVLHNGIDLDRYPAKTSTASHVRTQLGLRPDDLLLCAVGMINPRKGLAGLLDAFQTVAANRPGVHLAIVGAPIFNRDDLHLADLRQHTKRLHLADRVHFTGPRKDIPEILRAADLLILNALVEPFGLVLVEAMSSGTPVLATRVGGIPEIVTDSETGFLVPPGDSATLAARILAVLADSASRQRVAEAALSRVCPRFSRQRYTEGFAAFLQTHYAPSIVTALTLPEPSSPLPAVRSNSNA